MSLYRTCNSDKNGLLYSFMQDYDLYKGDQFFAMLGGKTSMISYSKTCQQVFNSTVRVRVRDSIPGPGQFREG